MLALTLAVGYTGPAAEVPESAAEQAAAGSAGSASAQSSQPLAVEYIVDLDARPHSWYERSSTQQSWLMSADYWPRYHTRQAADMMVAMPALRSCLADVVGPVEAASRQAVNLTAVQYSEYTIAVVGPEAVESIDHSYQWCQSDNKMFIDASIGGSNRHQSWRRQFNVRVLVVEEEVTVDLRCEITEKERAASIYKLECCKLDTGERRLWAA